MPQSPSFRIESVTRGLVSYIRLFGTVDESFDPNVIINAVEGRDVIINLKGVTRFSSFGVREWVHTMESLGRRADRLLFVECSPASVAQLNMVSNFSGPGTVVSVQAPYFCQKCSWDTEVIFELESSGQPRLEEKKVVCQRCGEQMSFEDDEETYFSFRSETNARPVDANLLQFIRDFSSAWPASPGSPSAPSPPPAGSSAPSSLSPSNVPVVPTAREPGAGPMDSAAGRPVKTTGRHWQIVLGVAVLVLIGGLIFVSMRSKPVPVEEVSAFYGYLDNLQLDAAESALSKLETTGSLSVDARNRFQRDLEEARQKKRAQELDTVKAAFARRQFATVLAAVPNLPAPEAMDTDTLFMVAESYRLSGRLKEAVSYYEKLANNPQVGDRLDDALFWQAESLFQDGKKTEAASMLERVVKIPGSEFIRSARRRLASLRPNPTPVDSTSTSGKATNRRPPRRKPKKKVDELFDF